MTPPQRRDQLLDVGQALFDQSRFDELSMEQIAGHAGVTRVLLYRYFPTKAHFFAAIWRRAHESLSSTARLDEARTVREWLVHTLAAYLEFYREHPQLVLIANRSPLAADPVVRQPIAANFRALGETALDAAGCGGEDRRLAETAFAGWIAFVRETTAAALIDGRLDHWEHLTLCVAALDATVGNYADLLSTPHS